MRGTLPKITLVLGGARSGKSRFAQSLPAKDQDVIFWATGVATDPEMERRIGVHRRNRPSHWKVVEEPRRLLVGLKHIQESGAKQVVLDSLTTWIGNLLYEPHSPEPSLEELRTFLEQLPKSSEHWIIVSDEVGMGVVPESPLGRSFRDLLGDANQSVAAQADHVYWVRAGIPQKIK